MIAVARIIRAHERTIARTLREEAGCGLSDLGDGLTWGEAKTLLEAYAEDPSTRYGAEIAGWSYRATIPELIALAAQIGKPTVAADLMPWKLKLSTEPAHTAAEVAEARAELEAGFVFA